MQREIQQLKSGSGSRSSQRQQQGSSGQQQQGNLVSLDSWSQGGNDSASGGWDAFSNHPEASREATSQAPAAQSSAMSPLSPQRQAAAAQAQAFIRTQASNVQSMQVIGCLFWIQLKLHPECEMISCTVDQSHTLTLSPSLSAQQCVVVMHTR